MNNTETFDQMLLIFEVLRGAEVCRYSRSGRIQKKRLSLIGRRRLRREQASESLPKVRNEFVISRREIEKT